MWSYKRYRKKLLGRVNNPLTLSPVELLLLNRWTKIKREKAFPARSPQVSRIHRLSLRATSDRLTPSV